MIDHIEVVKEAWRHFAAQWQTWVVMSLVCFVCIFAAAFTCVALPFVVGPLSAGMYVAAFKQLRGERPELADLWAGFNFFGPTLAITILGGLAIFCGYLLLIIPGLVLAIWWLFSIPAAVATGCGGFEAMSASRARVTQGFWSVVGFILVLMVVQMIAGFIPFGGVAIGMPLQTLAIAIVYRNLFGLEGALPPLRDPATAAPVAPAHRFCMKCGTANFATSRFCAACGQGMAAW
ncbi:MAG: hypothetical protein HYY18_16620 [Planctomycetes bacterium]|nr:hypothetical protein [Planctomycetota bacterium]